MASTNEYGSRRTTLDTGVNAFAHRRSRAGRASDGFTGLGASSSAQSRRQSSMTSGTGIRRSELAGSSTSVRSSGNFKSSKSKTKTRTKPNVPRGVLAVHVKQVRLQHWNVLQMFDRLDISVYVRIYVNGNCKWTSAYEYVTFPAMLILDDIKHFTLEISDRREDAANNIVIELVGFDRPDVHLVIARHSIHLYQIIKHLYAVESYTLKRMEKPIAELEVEYCFAYGQFGYGCSNQLENRQIQPKDQVSHSMFVRLEPPEGRRGDKPQQDIMTCVPVGHPQYIPFTCKAEIGDVAMAYGSELDMSSGASIDEPTLTISRIRKRLTNLQRQLGQQQSRKGRLNWLKDLVYNTKLTEHTGEEVLVPANFHVRRRTLMGTERHAVPQGGLMMSSNTTSVPASPNRRYTRRISRQDPEELFIKYGIASHEHRRKSTREDMEEEQPKKGRWGRLGSMFNWLFSRKPKEDGGRLPDETDEEMEERMIEERRKSSIRRRTTRFSGEFREDVQETILEEDEMEVFPPKGGAAEETPSTSKDAGTLGLKTPPRRRSTVVGATVESKENPEEEEEEEEDEFFDSQDGGYDRRRKDSGFQGLSADVATGRMQRRGSAMMGLMDLWERVEKGEGKSEEAGGSGQEGRPGGTSTVPGRRDSAAIRKDSVAVSREARRRPTFSGQPSLDEEEEEDEATGQSSRAGSFPMKTMRGAARLGSIGEQDANQVLEEEEEEEEQAPASGADSQAVRSQKGKKLWQALPGALRIVNTLQVALSGEQRRRITEVVNRGAEGQSSGLLRADYPGQASRAEARPMSGTSLGVPTDKSAQNRRKSLMDRAGHLFRNMVAETADGEDQARKRHKIVVPRVMFTPSTPEESDDSEYDSEDDYHLGL